MWPLTKTELFTAVVEGTLTVLIPYRLLKIAQPIFVLTGIGFLMILVGASTRKKTDFWHTEISRIPIETAIF